MHALDVLGEPVRRRILEVIGADEVSAGSVASTIGDELGLSQPASSQHLKILRESGLVTVRAVGTSRLYRIERDRLGEASAWFDQFGGPWQQPLDALETELVRGRRERRSGGATGATRAEVRPVGQVG